MNWPAGQKYLSVVLFDYDTIFCSTIRREVEKKLEGL